MAEVPAFADAAERDSLVGEALVGVVGPQGQAVFGPRGEHPVRLGDAAGDEVVTTGGLLGKVVDVGDTFLTLEVADGVRVKVQKFQIASLMPKGTLKSA